MTYRRRHRWLRRLALGLAVTSVGWDDGDSPAIGGIVLALVLGLGFGRMERPRLVGL